MDFTVEGDETVGVTLLSGAYALGTPAQATVTIVDLIVPTSGTNVWGGAGNASDPSNWSLGHVPTASEHVFLSDVSVSNMVWDIGLGGPSAHVAGWMQTEDYTGTVFLTAPFDAADPVLVVDGDVALEGGVWSHSGSASSETGKLYVRVDGDMEVVSSINVQNRGFMPKKGPGYVRGGSSHAGEGAVSCSLTNTYGSVFEPLRWGSGGEKGSYGGGGIIHLEVAGTLTVTGSISANGNGLYNNDGAGAGGSVLLRVGALLGTGSISADGGDDAWGGNGGGGRVAIYLQNADATRAQFGGTVTADGKSGRKEVGNGSYESGCGTVYWQTAQDADGSGTVFVHNPYLLNKESTVRRSCHLPSALGPEESYRKSNWVIQENAYLKLMADVNVNSLVIESSGTDNAAAKLNLNGRTMKTKTLNVLGTNYPPGTYRPADIAEGRVFDDSENGGGLVVVLPRFTLLLFR